MLDPRPMRAFLQPAVTALAALALSCDPGPPPAPVSPAAASARALVRPYVARNALRQATPRGAQGAVPGPNGGLIMVRPTNKKDIPSDEARAKAEREKKGKKGVKLEKKK